MFDNIIIVGGRGAVGSLFSQALLKASTASITVVDPRDDAAMDIRRPNQSTWAALEAGDLVVLATPEEIATEAAPELLARMRPDSLLVETLSVKSRFAMAIQEVHSGAQVLGLNPMFAPNLGFEGRSVIAVPYRGGAKTEAFLQIMATLGSRIVRMNVERHDRSCAMMQAATHASVLVFGMALRAGDYDLAELEAVIPPPHRTLLALLARMLQADSEVYRDIQAANPFAHAIRADIAAALGRLETIVQTGKRTEFSELFADLKHLFDHTVTDYPKVCARLFER